MNRPSAPPREDVAALILAAGQGERLGRGPKGALQLGGLTLIERAVRAVQPRCGRVLVAVPPGEAEAWQERLGDDARALDGGPDRMRSLAILLRASSQRWNVVHDAARPFVTAADVEAVLAGAGASGAASAIMHVQSHIALLARDRIRTVHDPRECGIMATPQAYSRDMLDRAFAYIARVHGSGYQWLCEALLEDGVEVAAVPLPHWSFKVTTEGDWRVARALVAALDSLQQDPP